MGHPVELKCFTLLYFTQVYERVGRSVISVVKKAQKSEQTLFTAVKKSRKRTDLFIFERLHLHQLKGMQSSKLGM